MARYRGQKALYEVIGGRARNASARPVVEPLRPEKQPVAKPPVVNVPPKVQTPPRERVVVSEKEVIAWKPKPLQWHDGRIEITVSTRTAIMIVLILIVGLLACFKTGQSYPSSQSGTLIEKENNVSPPEKSGLTPLASSNLPNRQLPAMPDPAPKPVEQTILKTEKQVVQPTVPARNTKPPAYGNAIVIQEFNAMADLVAVGRFFTARGIDTEIVSKGTKYFLITRERFPYNPEAANTRGNELLLEIRLKGQEYKAPQGLESFAPNKFRGAYGRNIDDQYIGEVIDVP